MSDDLIVAIAKRNLEKIAAPVAHTVESLLSKGGAPIASAALGGAAGAVMAPSDHRGEGAVRGAIAGGLTGLAHRAINAHGAVAAQSAADALRGEQAVVNHLATGIEGKAPLPHGGNYQDVISHGGMIDGRVITEPVSVYTPAEKAKGLDTLANQRAKASGAGGWMGQGTPRLASTTMGGIAGSTVQGDEDPRKLASDEAEVLGGALKEAGFWQKAKGLASAAYDALPTDEAIGSRMAGTLTRAAEPLYPGLSLADRVRFGLLGRPLTISDAERISGQKAIPLGSFSGTQAAPQSLWERLKNHVKDVHENNLRASGLSRLDKAQDLARRHGAGASGPSDLERGFANRLEASRRDIPVGVPGMGGPLPHTVRSYVPDANASAADRAAAYGAASGQWPTTQAYPPVAPLSPVEYAHQLRAQLAHVAAPTGNQAPYTQRTVTASADDLDELAEMHPYVRAVFEKEATGARQVFHAIENHQGMLKDARKGLAEAVQAGGRTATAQPAYREAERELANMHATSRAARQAYAAGDPKAYAHAQTAFANHHQAYQGHVQGLGGFSGQQAADAQRAANGAEQANRAHQAGASRAQARATGAGSPPPASGSAPTAPTVNVGSPGVGGGRPGVQAPTGGHAPAPTPAPQAPAPNAAPAANAAPQQAPAPAPAAPAVDPNRVSHFSSLAEERAKNPRFQGTVADADAYQKAREAHAAAAAEHQRLGAVLEQHKAMHPGLKDEADIAANNASMKSVQDRLKEQEDAMALHQGTVHSYEQGITRISDEAAALRAEQQAARDRYSLSARPAGEAPAVAPAAAPGGGGGDGPPVVAPGSSAEHGGVANPFADKRIVDGHNHTQTIATQQAAEDATMQPRIGQRAISGALGGAATGYMAADDEHKGQGALVGAAAGGALGGGIGHMEHQRARTLVTRPLQADMHGVLDPALAQKAQTELKALHDSSPRNHVQGAMAGALASGLTSRGGRPDNERTASAEDEPMHPYEKIAIDAQAAATTPELTKEANALHRIALGLGLGGGLGAGAGWMYGQSNPNHSEEQRSSYLRNGALLGALAGGAGGAFSHLNAASAAAGSKVHNPGNMLADKLVAALAAGGATAAGGAAYHALTGSSQESDSAKEKALGTMAAQAEARAVAEQTLAPQQRMIFEAVVTSDPTLAHADPELLADSFRTMCRTAPRLATDKSAVKSFLREVASYGTGPNYVTIKNLAEAEKAVNQSYAAK